MPRHGWALACFALLALLGTTSRASADRDYDDLVDHTRLYGGVWLGFGGDAELDGDGDFGGRLETTVGGQVGLDQVTGRNFSLGGEVRIGAIQWKRAGDRSRLIDLDFKPRLRFPIMQLPIEFYVAFPVGVTVPRLPDVDAGPTDGKIGWNVGVGGGLTVFLSEHIGLNAEPIWLMHRFKVEGEGRKNDFTIKQFSVLLNGVLAF